MSKYIIISNKAEQFQDQKHLLFYLQKLNPAIEIQAALVITVPDALDCLIQSLDGVPMAGPATVASPATRQEAISISAVSTGAPDAKALANKVAWEIRKRKKYTRRPTTTMICSQCNKEREPTKSGICKICAMANARKARKNGQAIAPSPAARQEAGYVGKEERKVNASTRTEERFITHHGSIKGKKLA
jgi:hypothetical protein